MKSRPVDEPDMLVLQFGPQFKQLHKSELHFMRIICQPTKEQFAKIEADTGAGGSKRRSQNSSH